MLEPVRVINPYPPSAVPRIWTWIQEFRDRVQDDYGPQTMQEFMESWNERQQSTWGVWRGSELGGVVVCQVLTPVVVSSHCLFRKDFWGHATTLEALRQVYAEVFEQYHKITSLVFADNSHIIHICRKLGGDTEGKLRQHTKRRGQLVDMVALGLTKEAFERCQSESPQCSPSLVAVSQPAP